MIKKLLARLTGWGERRNFDPLKNKAQEDLELQRELAEERRQRNLESMPEGERLRRQAEELRNMRKGEEAA